MLMSNKRSSSYLIYCRLDIMTILYSIIKIKKIFEREKQKNLNCSMRVTGIN